MKNFLKVKRICLFAGYNANKKIPLYVLDYLEELSNYADIFYLADGDLNDGELLKLDTICKSAWVLNHKKYDFGSYSELANNYVGWDKIREYDELIFANDSCFCFQSFAPVFHKMYYEECDVWGLIATDENNKDCLYSLTEYLNSPSKISSLFCLGSYFLVFRKKIILDRDFVTFINTVQKEKNRYDVCIKYEMGLTRFFINKGYLISAYIKIVYKNVVIYDKQGIRLLKKGFPLVKIRIFKDNPLSIKRLSDLIPIIAKYSGNYKIFKYLEEVGYKCNDHYCHYWDDIKYWFIPPIVKKGTLIRSIRISFSIILNIFQNSEHIIKKVKNIENGSLLVKNVTTNLVGYFFPKIIIQLLNWIKSFSYKKGGQLIKKIDNNNLDCYKNSNYLVVFFNVAKDNIGGGMLSINRFVEQSKKLEEKCNFKVIVSGLPFTNTVVNYSKFKSALPMIHFSNIVSQLMPEKLLLHIPEHYAPIFIQELIPSYKRWLNKIPELQINIMDQNHELFPEEYYIECCREFTDDLTITTAHIKYTTQELASKLVCPVTLLTPFLPELKIVPSEKKEKIILLSPDNLKAKYFSKSLIIEKIKDELPDYQIITINNLSLEEYIKLISRSRYVITFGEGYDGYYVEPTLCGTIAFAVYNETFFPDDFKIAPTIYQSWEELYENIVSDIRYLDKNSKFYEKNIIETISLIKKFTNNQISMSNLEDFYERNYSFLPDIFKDDILFREGNNLIDPEKNILDLKNSQITEH